MSKSLPPKGASATVARAVRDAERVAPDDDQQFFERLKEAVAHLAPPEPSSGRALSRSRSNQRARVRDDPRYTANLREVARQSGNARIIGGAAVPAGEFEDCVAVGDDSNWGCTGTLIARNVVLTAAHCESLHSRVFVGPDVTKLSSGRVFKVKRHVRHPKFDSEFRNDLMILILDKPVTGVKPRQIAPKTLIDKATVARLVGFGSTRLDGFGQLGAKLQTDVPIVSQACKGKVNGDPDGEVYGCHLNREIVAGKPLLLQDSCKGDSGGPLFVADSKGKWCLAGATSRGTDLAKTMCGDGGIYVRVDMYASWIESVLKKA